MGMTRDSAWDFPLGLVAPANFALHVARYLHESPATREHLAMVGEAVRVDEREGVLRGLNAEGALLLEVDGRSVPVHAGTLRRA